MREVAGARPCGHRGRAAALALALACVASAGAAQGRPLTREDSALVGRILLAEDSRDSSSAAFADGLAHTDARVQLLARRGLARARDPRFAARDSFPPLPAPPVYPEPAWRLRFRALAGKGGDCALMRDAMRDGAWQVRLRAMDLVTAACSADSAVVRELRAYAGAVPGPVARKAGGVSWHASAHALVALARMAPGDRTQRLVRDHVRRGIAPQRVHAAIAARLLRDSVALAILSTDRDANVREAAATGLAAMASHGSDRALIAGLRHEGYQAIRAAAGALKGSPSAAAVLGAAIDAARRLRRDSSETSRDARIALLDRIGDFATPADTAALVGLAHDFDCTVAGVATTIARRLGATLPAGDAPFCTPFRPALPRDAVALALGASVQLLVTMAPSAGGGSFTVQLRGDLAPVMAARILDLVRNGYYNGLSWHRVEPDFVIQGGSPDASEYVGFPRFVRDELGAVPHPRGTVGMSTRGHDTGDAQWFVNLRDNPRLTRDYSIFGQVTRGIEVVDGVLEGDTIASITIEPGAP